MNTELLTVTDTAKAFLEKSGYMFSQLQRATFDPDRSRWVLVFNVGISHPNLKIVEIDDPTGKVVSIE